MVFKSKPVSSEHTEPEHNQTEPESEHGSEHDPGSDSDVAEILTQIDDFCDNLRSLVVATDAPNDDRSSEFFCLFASSFPISSSMVQ